MGWPVGSWVQIYQPAPIPTGTLTHDPCGLPIPMLFTSGIAGGGAVLVTFWWLYGYLRRWWRYRYFTARIRRASTPLVSPEGYLSPGPRKGRRRLTEPTPGGAQESPSQDDRPNKRQRTISDPDGAFEATLDPAEAGMSPVPEDEVGLPENDSPEAREIATGILGELFVRPINRYVLDLRSLQ